MGAGFVFCFNCIFPRFLITVLWTLILMSSRQGAQTLVTAGGELADVVRKKYKMTIDQIFMVKSIYGCFWPNKQIIE